MMSTNNWLKPAAVAGALWGCGLGAAQDVWAADSTVPSSWNVAPMTNGAYRESFETSLPGWAGRVGASVLSNLTYATTGIPARSNEWFSTHQKVLLLDTEGDVVTNSVAYPGAEGSVSFASKPVYVDMRVRFDPISDPPAEESLTDAKLALFVSADAKLVAVHANGWTTNSTVLDTNLWYQVTVKMLDGKFDVLLNDAPVPVMTNLVLKNVGANTLTAASFCGTGLIDDLYISHGNPAYVVAGPTGTIPTLPADGSNVPSDEEQTRINTWLDGYPITSLGTMTQDQLSQAYLLNELTVTDGVASSLEYTFGISAIDIVSPTLLQVTLSLASDTWNKNGTLNGRIQLEGKTSIDGTWTLLSGAITPSFADFTNGKATYTFAIPEGGYQFFKPVIVP